jgi:hypothetical protein
LLELLEEMAFIGVHGVCQVIEKCDFGAADLADFAENVPWFKFKTSSIRFV